jgi:hypothetical protein
MKFTYAANGDGISSTHGRCGLRIMLRECCNMKKADVTYVSPLVIVACF